MNRICGLGATIALGLGLLAAMAAQADTDTDDPIDGELPPVTAEATVDLGLDEVWELWTTSHGLETFFSRKATVDLRIDGTYDIWFFPDLPPGLRGAEGMRILAVEEPTRLLVTWNSPATFGAIAEQRTVVEFRFTSRTDRMTDVEIRHFGWGRTETWRDIHAYFQGAWGVVLRRFEYSATNGRVDWDDLPPNLRYSAPKSAHLQENERGFRSRPSFGWSLACKATIAGY